MPEITEFSLPSDDLVHLGTAFDLIGKHRFGPLWAKDMAAAVRLSCRRAAPTEKRVRAQWALKALTQCIENGWLPLVYFADDRRVRYFEGSNGLTLHALYPRPTDDAEGQIELTGGDIFPCMIDKAKLGDVLRAKFAKPTANRTGPRRSIVEFDEAVDRFFDDNRLDMPNCDVIAGLGPLREEHWPQRTTMHSRINEVRARAIARIRSATNSGRTSGGQ